MMIDRYTRKEMRAVWTDENRLKTWLDVELAAMKALEEQGTIPAGTADGIRKKAMIKTGRMLEIEEQTHHDVVAFTQMITEQLGEEGRWLHYGLTSSDVGDTALCILIRDAMVIIIKDFNCLAETVKAQAYKYKSQLMVGRTHGVHAEPTTFGFKLAIWYAEIRRNITRLEKAKENISVGKFSGPVGTFAHLGPDIEKRACELLKLEPAPISSQIIQRDRHSEVMTVLAICAGSLEKFATEIRHLQRTEVREAEEPFVKGQKGSSSMPHKRNPVKCENVCGLARLIRSYAIAALENMPLWHERDISHSSSERVILPDAFILLNFISNRFDKIMENLIVYPEAMETNLNKMKGLVYSGTVLLHLVEAGLSREEAYKIVQRNSMKVWETGEDFKDILAKDPDFSKAISSENLRKMFDAKVVLKNIDAVFERVFEDK
jgi:adenylosuccinate lyase